MEKINRHGAAGATVHPAWQTLDEAAQMLVRAESLVLLLGVASDVEQHHAFGAEIACDILRALKEKLSDAQDQIRPSSSRKIVR
jgi:hypothetical protein